MHQPWILKQVVSWWIGEGDVIKDELNVEKLVKIQAVRFNSSYHAENGIDDIKVSNDERCSRAINSFNVSSSIQAKNWLLADKQVVHLDFPVLLLNDGVADISKMEAQVKSVLEQWCKITLVDEKYIHFSNKRRST